tara:strand:+ start:77 stop:589 length:513 start_codon:yes stop_codon:yes gene_type:complete
MSPLESDRAPEDVQQEGASKNAQAATALLDNFLQFDELQSDRLSALNNMSRAGHAENDGSEEAAAYGAAVEAIQALGEVPEDLKSLYFSLASLLPEISIPQGYDDVDDRMIVFPDGRVLVNDSAEGTTFYPKDEAERFIADMISAAKMRQQAAEEMVDELTAAKESISSE